MILVVGATGELGSAVTRRTCAKGVGVRALVRRASVAEELSHQGVEVWRGDLLDPGSLRDVCDGVRVVIATANSIVPSRGERTSPRALNRGYLRLADEAEAAGVRRFVFVSAPRELIGRGAAEFDAKVEIEEYLDARKFEVCVIRPSLFMESWLPAVGSRLAVAGSLNATLNRGFWLSRFAGAVLHRTVDRWGIALHPGLSSATRHSFVAVSDVAAAVVHIATTDAAVPRDLPLGGPEALTWSDVVQAHSDALDRRIRSVRIPASAFWVLSLLARPFSPTAANLLQVQSLVGRRSTVVAEGSIKSLLGHSATSVATLLETSATSYGEIKKGGAGRSSR